MIMTYHQSIKDCEADTMKLLIVLCLCPLYSANSDSFYPGFPFFPPPKHDKTGSPTTYDIKEIKSFADLRTTARELISTLRDLQDEPKASETIKKLFSDENSVCLSSMEEAIEAIEEGTRLVEDAEGDFMALQSRIESLLGQKSEVEVMREVASILRALQPLLTKITPANPSLCAASTDSTFAYLRRLALIFHELSEESEDHKAMLERAASTISAVTVFLNQLRSEARLVQSLCQPDRQSTVSGLRALTNIIANLADMTAVVGNHRTAEDIRKGNLITEKIMVSGARAFNTYLSFFSSRARYRT